MDLVIDDVVVGYRSQLMRVLEASGRCKETV